MEPGACWTSVPNFMEIVQAVKKLNSISRERLNFRRRPILCTTLYRNPMQASNFGGTFDHSTFPLSFLWNFHRRCVYTLPLPWCKNVKNDQKLKSRGSCLKKTRFSITTSQHQTYSNWSHGRFLCLCVCACPSQTTNGLPSLPPPRTRNAMRKRDYWEKNWRARRQLLVFGPTAITRSLVVKEPPGLLWQT